MAAQPSSTALAQPKLPFGEILAFLLCFLLWIAGSSYGGLSAHDGTVGPTSGRLRSLPWVPEPRIVPANIPPPLTLYT